jgi:hypothetical protein
MALSHDNHFITAIQWWPIKRIIQVFWVKAVLLDESQVRGRELLRNTFWSSASLSSVRALLRVLLAFRIASEF